MHSSSITPTRRPPCLTALTSCPPTTTTAAIRRDHRAAWTMPARNAPAAAAAAVAVAAAVAAGGPAVGAITSTPHSPLEILPITNTSWRPPPWRPERAAWSGSTITCRWVCPTGWLNTLVTHRNVLELQWSGRSKSPCTGQCDSKLPRPSRCDASKDPVRQHCQGVLSCSCSSHSGPFLPLCSWGMKSGWVWTREPDHWACFSRARWPR